MKRRIKVVKSKVYTPQEINRAIGRVWSRLSAFLKVDLNWTEFLSSNRKKFKNFEGFKIRKSKIPFHWSGGFVKEKRGNRFVTYLYLDFYPRRGNEFDRHFDHRLCHQLVHILRGTIHQNQFKPVFLIHYILEEALCNVVATKALDERGSELSTYGLHEVIEVCAVEQILYSMRDDEVRRFALMPRSEPEAKELASLMLKWLPLQQFVRNYQTVWPFKIKEELVD